MTSTPDYGEIDLDGMRFKLAADISVSAVDRFPPKITIGDYSQDSNDLLSSWVISDLSGGHGVADLDEGTDTNRYHWGTINTRYPKQWAKPFRRYGELVSTSYVYPLGDMTISGATTRYAVAGTHRLYSDIPTGTPLTTTHWTDRGAITGIPTDKAVAYTGTAANPMLYVPQGNNGYSVYDTSGPTLRNVTAQELMVSFCLWDNKLIGIDTDGQLYEAITATAAGDTVFTDYGDDGKLDPAFRPKHLITYYNRAGDPAIYVITDQNVWVFDPSTPRLYLVPDLSSPNPRFGDACCTWRGLLYISSGMDLYEFNGTVRRNVGLSRDDGPTRENGSGGQHSLPYQYLNTIVDLIPSQNSLYAYVKGKLISGSLYYSSMQEWSSYGWCTNWTSALSTNGPSWGAMSRAGGGDAFLWWGDLGQASTNANTGFQPFPTNDTNPREAMGSGAYLFGTGGTGIAQDDYALETGEFDGGMPGYTKVASALSITLDDNSESVPIGVPFYYRVNGGAYQGPNSIDTGGTKTGTFQFGQADSNGLYPGMTFKRIELKFAAWNESFSTTVLVKNAIFTFRKVQNPSLAWTALIDLKAPHDGNNPDTMRAKLTTLRTQGVFFTMKHQNNVYRVTISGVSGQEHLGKDHRGQVTVSILEIPQATGVPV